MSAQPSTLSPVVQARLLQIIHRPHISEKTTRIGEKYRQVVFHVAADATKDEIKKAVEMLFDVKLESVRVCNVKGKQRRFQQIAGKRKDWKKAYVTLKEGFDINFAAS